VTMDPSTVAGHVRGLITPCATSSLSLAAPSTFRCRTPPSTSSVLERSWALPFKGFPSTAIGTPFGAHALLPLPPTSSAYPKVGRVCGRSPTGPCSRGESVLHRGCRRRTPSCSGRRSLHGLHYSSELAPARSGSRFGRGASPRTLWGGDVPVRLGLRVLRFEQVGQPVSGSPALMSFLTLQQRCSVQYSEKEGQRIGVAATWLQRFRRRRLTIAFAPRTPASALLP
jgi:hypothetical protein